MALALGKTVGELLATLTAREWAHWVAYDRLDPVGRERLDALAGHAIAASLTPWGKEGEPPPRPLDLIPDWGGLRALEGAERRKAEPAGDVADDWREYGETTRRMTRG